MQQQGVGIHLVDRSIEKTMPQLRNKRHEKFALDVFKSMPLGDSAIDAGYTPARAYSTGSRLARNGKIMERIAELFRKAESDAVMTVQERMAMLSEIGRARFTDFVTCGPDGSWVDIGSENKHGAALSEVSSRTEYDENGDHPTVYTKIKLHNPITAINELNKMDGSHAPTKITDGEGKPLIAPMVTFHFSDGSLIKPPRNNGHVEVEVAAVDNDGNGHKPAQD